jgi:hypothetical protein
VSAVVNTSSTDSGGSYAGVANTGTVWYAPNAYNNYYNFYTNFVVQNATASPVNITVDIINGAGATVATQTASNVPAYAFANFEQAGLAGMNTNVNYSAKITGTGALAVESNIYGQGTAANQLFSYRPFTTGSLTAYAPVIMNNYYTYNTALTVQNLGATSTDVTVTYGTGLTENATIPANSSTVFYTPNSGLPSGNSQGLTSAKIESSSQNIVALVNESGAYLRSASYSAFAVGSTTVSLPIVMKHYYQYNTSVTCQNVGTSNTNITITYSGSAATSTQNNVQPNQTALFYQPNEAGLPATNYNGSATVTSSSQPIVCVTNEDRNDAPYGTTAQDQLFSYEGFAAP